ncbi:MAG: hypothetical protein RLP44_16590 [Aggregatilineales bacterium]
MATWMLLEDEPDLYDMILMMYDMLGLRGVAFSTGEEAAEWVDAVNAGEYEGELPQLALIDIRLPDSISGTQIAAKMRKSPQLKKTVIALMTAYKLSVSEENEIMKISGADLLLYKPFPRLHELHFRLKSLLAERGHG